MVELLAAGKGSSGVAVVAHPPAALAQCGLVCGKHAAVDPLQLTSHMFAAALAFLAQVAILIRPVRLIRSIVICI